MCAVLCCSVLTVEFLYIFSPLSLSLSQRPTYPLFVLLPSSYSSGICVQTVFVSASWLLSSHFLVLWRTLFHTFCLSWCSGAHWISPNTHTHTHCAYKSHKPCSNKTPYTAHNDIYTNYMENNNPLAFTKEHSGIFSLESHSANNINKYISGGLGKNP